MTNSEDQAFPGATKTYESGFEVINYEPGMTKRELIVKDFACALVSSVTWRYPPDEAVKRAIELADELIKQLNTETSPRN